MLTSLFVYFLCFLPLCCVAIRPYSTHVLNHTIKPMGSLTIQEDISVQSIYLNGTWYQQWTNVTALYVYNQNWWENIPSTAQYFIIIIGFVLVYFAIYLTYCYMTDTPIFFCCQTSQQQSAVLNKTKILRARSKSGTNNNKK